MLFLEPLAWPGCRKAHFHDKPCFPELAFFNCHEGREHASGGGASLANASEAELAAVLYGGASYCTLDYNQLVGPSTAAAAVPHSLMLKRLSWLLCCTAVSCAVSLFTIDMITLPWVWLGILQQSCGAGKVSNLRQLCYRAAGTVQGRVRFRSGADALQGAAAGAAKHLQVRPLCLLFCATSSAGDSADSFRTLLPVMQLNQTRPFSAGS